MILCIIAWYPAINYHLEAQPSMNSHDLTTIHKLSWSYIIHEVSWSYIIHEVSWHNNHPRRIMIVQWSIKLSLSYIHPGTIMIFIDHNNPHTSKILQSFIYNHDLYKSQPWTIMIICITTIHELSSLWITTIYELSWSYNHLWTIIIMNHKHPWTVMILQPSMIVMTLQPSMN